MSVIMGYDSVHRTRKLGAVAPKGAQIVEKIVGLVYRLDFLCVPIQPSRGRVGKL
jgi:hypothetical protein